MIDTQPEQPRLFQQVFFREQRGTIKAFEKILGAGGESIVKSQILLEEGNEPVDVAVVLCAVPTPEAKQWCQNSQKWLKAIFDLPQRPNHLVIPIGFGEDISVVEQFGEGYTLYDVMKQQHLNSEEIIDVLTQIGNGLDELYLLQVNKEKPRYYGDLKPSNCLVHNSSIRLTDFSLINNASREVGTIQYLAPERFIYSGDSFGKEIDVYALGVIAFEMLIGQHPFIQNSSNTFKEARADIENQRLKGFIAQNKQGEKVVGFDAKIEELQQVLERVLEKDPAIRYDSHWDFIHELEKVLLNFPADVKFVPLEGTKRSAN